MVKRSLLLFAAAIVILCCGIALGGHPDKLPGPVANALVGDKDARFVREAIDEVQARYYRKIPRADLANQAISGLVASLNDRFSQYLSPKAYASFKQSQNSEFTGVGITVAPEKNGELRIVEVFDGSPAQAAKLRRNDLIVAVDGRSLHGMASARAVALIKGRPETSVLLRISTGGKEREVRVGRAIVTVPAVASRLVTEGGKKIGVVRLAQFSSGAHAEVAAGIRKLEKQGAKGLVLDLRSNPGGLVSEAQLVASEFLEDGKIVTTKGRAVPPRTLDATGDAIAPKTPLVVLVNGDSASASEIVAGALQDRGRAKLVGTKTFGKGVFQQVIELSNGGALDITAGQYFTPSGRNLGGKGVAQGAGLAPDVEAADDPKTKADEPLDAAVRTVAGEIT